MEPAGLVARFFTSPSTCWGATSSLLPHVPGSMVRISYASTFLLASKAMLFSSPAQAMEIRQFDKMAKASNPLF